MIPKTIKIPKYDKQGARTVQRIDTRFSLTKVAMPVASEVIEFARNLKAEPNKIYAMVGAIGASEYWGPNLNADWWPEDQLKHKGLDYGYQTFLNAHVFAHHQNSDPGRAIGRVIFAAWNDYMKRIEVVIEVDRDKAFRFGGEWIVKALENDEPIEFSMGCKVAHDVCSYPGCGFKTPTPRIRCEHIRDPKIKGSVLPDGSVVAMINIRPRFFDFSGVTLRADNNGYLIEKLVPPPAEMMKAAGFSAEPGDGLEKTAELEVSIESDPYLEGNPKYAEIAKRLMSWPPETMVLANRGTPTIPAEELGKFDPSKAVQTSAAMGIPLKPEEFQALALQSMGAGGAARTLDQRGIVFDESADLPSVGGGMLGEGPPAADDEIARLLGEYLPGRGLVGAPLGTMRQAVLSKPVGVTIQKVTIRRVPLRSPVLDKIGGMYRHYAQTFIERLPQIVMAAADSPHVTRCENLLPEGAEKTAGFVGDLMRSAVITQMLARHAGKQQAIGAPVSGMAAMARQMPLSFLASGALIMDKLTPAHAGKPVGPGESSLLLRAITGGP